MKAKLRYPLRRDVPRSAIREAFVRHPSACLVVHVSNAVATQVFVDTWTWL